MNQETPKKPLERAILHSKKADLAIVLGKSYNK
jgi:hypothetical protein